MKNRILSLPALAVLLSLTAAAMADVHLPEILSDHAVLQKGHKVPIWGKAEPGEAVSVSLNDQTVETTTGEDGRWRVSLNLADSPAGPFEMRVRGNNTLTIKDVVVGEVWLGAGQSNMEQSMFAQNPEEAAKAVNPMHREFIVEKRMSLEPEEAVKGFWVLVKPGETESMGAAGYFFGKALSREIQRPVGMIKAAWGGRTNMRNGRMRV
jgi:sialate O-acetylesterase